MTTSISTNESINRSLGWAAAGAGLFLAASTVFHELTKYRLAGKVVLVTGGSRGLGLELARQLVAKGARVAICSRTTSQLYSAKEELVKMGGDILALPVDVTKQEEVQILVRDVVNHFGQLDVLINNAGTIQVGPQETMDIKDYEDAMDSNFWSALYTMHASLPHFIKQGEGRIINITSIGGKIAVPHLLPYSASKFALVGLSEGMHAELKKQNIHVTTVVPNLMRTGSPGNATIKGDHEAEYAWFKFSDSLPLTSQAVEHAAYRVVKALEYGESEAVLTITAKMATMLKGFAPTWINALLSFTNRFLPENIPGGFYPRKGYEVESEKSRGKIPAYTDRAAIRNNETVSFK
ncbi:MAG TPA: SDR family NAD(P)-dependent oxidoreductase [Ohtaekwangia sp.]|nr:SDR family NAD(P)-dependent oxidoreductase [Ohtaekwangia sp.]